MSLSEQCLTCKRPRVLECPETGAWGWFQQIYPAPRLHGMLLEGQEFSSMASSARLGDNRLHRKRLGGAWCSTGPVELAVRTSSPQT